MARVCFQFVLLYVLFGGLNAQGWSTGDNYNRNYGQNDHYSGSNNAFGFGGGGNTLDPFRMVYEWKQLDYNWFDENIRSQSLTNKRYIPENNALAGIKVWRDRMFVTIPRWKEGVPVTLASVPVQPIQGNLSPRLEAFPNWQMQEIGNCSALQFVQSMEIDTEGRMWIIDSGRVNILSGGGHDSRCPPKLVIIDLNSVQFAYSNQFGSGPNQFGPGPNQFGPGPNQFGQGPNQFGQPPNNYPNPYGNNPYHSNNPNLPYSQNQQYNSNPPYNTNNPSNNPNQQYNSNPPYNVNNPGNNPNVSPYNQNPYNRNNNPPPPYNTNYPNSNPNYPNQGQYGSQGTNYPQGFNNYPGYNSSNPQYDQFGNFINNQQRNYQGPYPNQGFSGNNYNPSFPFPNAFNNNNFRIVKMFNFPSNVATQYGSYLNDIVLDDSNGWYAYITDHGDDPGIIVYSLRDDRSWKVKDATSMRADTDTTFVSINSIDVDLQKKNLDGIALSPAMGYERTLYYCPLGSYNLYSVPTSVLKNPNLSSDISSSVRDLGRKQSITDGMIMDNRGILYFGLLGMNAIATWDSNRGSHRIDDGARILARDNNFLQWPDTFSIDDTGNLYVVTNRLQNYLTGRVNLNEGNYRIFRAALNVRSYLHHADSSRRGGAYDGQSHGGYDGYWGSGYNNYYYNSVGMPSVSVFLLVSLVFYLVAR